MKKKYLLFLLFLQTFQVIWAVQIEAENYSSMNGISIVTTTDVSGGQQLNLIKNGDWVEYGFNASAGTYDFSMRVASNTNGGTIRIKENGVIIGHVVVKNTGDWTNWQTLSVPVKFLSSGTKTIRLEFIGVSGALFNLNWFDYTVKSLGTSSFAFSTKGKPTSLVINGNEILNGADSFNSFNLLKFSGGEVETTNDFSSSVSGNVLTLSANKETLVLKFRIDTYPRHVSLHLIDVQGIDGRRDLGIRFQLKSNKSLGHFALTEMVGSSFTESSLSYRGYWRYLYQPGIEGYKGGLVFWDGSLTGASLDETLAEIWTTEGIMPKPAQQPSWTESDVLNWVDNYASKFNNMTQALLEPTSNADLYSLVNTYVIPNKIKKVYLHCKTWRGEYWVNNNSMLNVNTAIFPNGKSDLKAFADYLHANNILLQLHNVSFGIGKNDPNYIMNKVDRRLASWGKGTLEYPISASDKTIYFRPATGVSVPFSGISSHVNQCLKYEYFRVGEEIIQCGSVNRTDKDVWILSNCTRGLGGTNAFAFPAGEELTGLYLGYGIVYGPEFDLGQVNSLANELTLEYANFVNEIGLDHLHFDGPEIHDVAPFMHDALYSKVYSYTNRPTTASRVGGSISANFELNFSPVKDDKSYSYFPIEVGIRLDGASSTALATSFLDVQFHINETLVMGARRLILTGSYHDLGISTASVATHGLSSEIFKIFSELQELTPVFDDADMNYLATTMTAVGSHYQGNYVNVLSKNTDNKYIYTPYLVLGLSNGSTAPWKIEQEIGTQPRKQTTTTGATLTLTNPEPQSDLNLIFRVSDATKSLVDPKVTLGNGGYIQFTGTIAPGQYLQYEAGATTATSYDKNWNVIATIPVTKSNFIGVNGNFTALLTGTVASVAVETQYYVKGTPYVLATNAKL